MPDVAIETVELEPQAALVVCRKVAIADLGEALADILPRVYRHIAGASQQPAGMPFTRYFDMDGVTFDIAAGMPVRQTIDGTGDIEEHVLPGGRALTALHLGAYQDVGAVWSQVVQRARELGSDAMFGWDVYTNDPDEVAPEALETRVYLPL
ncbi:MAG: GyrI-like domain-containing protein [Gammaproteobacteria bacterium]|nr:GyrI-like domain-containing protein [Gammaproteobacteria bacterium]MYF27290.1 GyrI-like domain-containing protein [Gammaproteobacteria bacterium]MYK45334.1 GyrI-like domain-containing protein [Gammaproteobacteria bacterium]